ncbi:MAG: cytochrome c [Acidimicrobiia bacterium]|nr:cytochrome c [Acidimicrobiia bacterium]
MILTTLSEFVLAVDEAGPVSPSNANWGQLALIFVASAVLVWMVYLFVASRRSVTPAPEETAKNLQPYMSDDELENNRLTRVLGAAVVAAAVLAIALPVYYWGEADRQAEAAEAFHEKDVEEGEHWYEVFECIGCHGPDAGGGGAEFIEARSGLSTTWAAPSLNDIFYRYSDDEVEYWLNYGRSGTPMPVIGLVGGGAATVQEIDQLIEYLRSVQISQAEALGKADGLVSQALNRLAGAEVAVSQLVRQQQAVVDDILDAPAVFDLIETIPDEIRSLMAADGTCTDESAAVVGSVCNAPGPDTDRDGLSDQFELQVAGPDNELSALAASSVLVRNVIDGDVVGNDDPVTFDADGNAAYEFELVPSADYPAIYSLSLSPLDAFTMEDASGEPMPDLDALEVFLTDLDTAKLNFGVLAERNDRFLENAESSYDFLVDAFEQKAWEVDIDQVAADTGLSFDDAERAVGLYNAFCARCHTAGYSAGVAYEQGAGSGAWGPALTGGRSVVQFPDAEDQITFIIRGSNLAEDYGVNGIGRGWMPGFGQILTEEDIRLIVSYERSM